MNPNSGNRCIRQILIQTITPKPITNGGRGGFLDFCVILYLCVSFSFGVGSGFSGVCVIAGQFDPLSVQIFPRIVSSVSLIPYCVSRGSRVGYRTREHYA